MLDGSHMGKCFWSCLVAWTTEIRGGSLGEGLFHCSNMVGLDEQRWSMVLELYCRKAERKREGRKERPAMATWRKGKRRGKGELGMRREVGA